MSDSDDVVQERTFETLLEAVEVHKTDAVAYPHTKKFFMNCRRPEGCKGREVYIFSKDADKMGSTYQCTSCSFRWHVQIGGAFNF